VRIADAFLACCGNLSADIVIDLLNQTLASTVPAQPDAPVRRGIISVRPETADDLDFSAQLYALTRAAELAAVQWPDEAKAAFCRQQFDAQHAHYQKHYPTAQLLIVLEDGRPIGRLYFERTSKELRLMEITLHDDARNRGIGGGISQTLLDLAHRDGLPMGLHVESFNPARRLYLRQGFEDVELRGIYHYMLCPPKAAA
jgi:GNAT superfamily N-acetyltransferase